LTAWAGQLGGPSPSLLGPDEGTGAGPVPFVTRKGWA
jgi:hypothetical protein